MATHEAALFLLTAFNALSDQWTAFCAGTSKVASGLWHYFTGTTNKWYFLPYASVPIPAPYYTNRHHGLETPDTIRLEYDTLLGVLTYRPLHIVAPRTIQSLPWLSATLSVNGRIFNMDNWAHRFRFYMLTESGGWFTPRTFVSCWSIDAKIWPTQTDNTFLNVIDNEGTSHRFSVYGEYDEDAWLRCLGDTESDSETDSETETETETDAEAEADADADAEENEEEDTELPTAEATAETAIAETLPSGAVPEQLPQDSPGAVPEGTTAETTTAETVTAETVTAETVTAETTTAEGATAEDVTAEAVTAETTAEATVETASAEERPTLIISGVSEYQQSLGALAPAPAPAPAPAAADVDTLSAAVSTATVATMMTEVD
jgi:hypothetical protein